MSKSRVAPLKKLTLPQLELMAAVVGARLASYLRNQLKITRTVYWSDSQIVIHWLSSTKELKQFVKNRVIEIRKSTSNATWNYCPSSDNPADLLTRGVRTDALSASELWNNGPTWLTNQDSWPNWNPRTVLLQTLVPEDPQTDHDDSPSNETPQSTLASHVGIGNVINLSNFSDLQRLLKTTAWVLRFVNILRKSQASKSSTLNVSEVIHAKNVWIREIQSQVYHNELANLQHKTASRLLLVRQLRLFLLDDNIIRCGGRIHNAPVPFSTKFSVLLPPNNHFTTLVINDAHERSLHSGLNHTLTHVRQHYWIPQARQFIKKLLRHCVTCRKVNGKPYKAPDPPPLPKTRLVDSHPFTVTGVDFTGAIYLKTSPGQEKVYICLFTCANTRAVHLEVVTDLTVPTFVAAFRRFASRKSLPKVMISDNASTYQSAADELTQLLNSSELTSQLGNRGIEWKFIPKRAPWNGRFWERLIGLTKLFLKKVLGKTNITLDEFQTITAEIEAILKGAVSYFTHIFFSFFLAFLQTFYGFSLIKTYKLHYFYLILYSETTDRGEITVTTTFTSGLDLCIFPCFKYIVYQINSFALIDFLKMISFDFHHLGAIFRPELSRFPPCSPSFEGAILDSKLENVGPTLSSLLCAEAYACNMTLLL